MSSPRLIQPAAAGDWHIAKVDANEIFNVSCASVTLCVAVDNAGGIVTSSHPVGGMRAWRLATVDVNSFYGVSCTEARFCLAVDDAGGVVIATDPTGGAGAWHYADRDGDHSFYNVSCPTASFCVAVDTVGNAVTTHNPTELVALEESVFPFHTAMARVATTETNGSGHYSFTVHLSVATRFRVVGLGSFNRGVSPVQTIYEVERYAGSITRCTTEPTCTVIWVIRYQLPKQVATRELAEPFRIYLGVTRRKHQAAEDPFS